MCILWPDILLLTASNCARQVGTDQRFSGHFTYATLPEWCGLPGAPLPLRCTSRGRVMDWLHAAGAREAVKPDQVKVRT